MNVLVINCGSSSLKFQLIDSESENVLAKGLCERIGIDGSLTYQPAGGEKVKSDKAMPTHTEAIQFVIDALTDADTGVVKSLDEIGAVGHRVVHGGEKFASSVVITDEVLKAIEECNDLAPLHNPANLIGIRACQELMPKAPMVAVFDTAFHQTLEPRCYIYPIPYRFYTDYKVRKYGAHGTSHYYVSQKVIEKLGNPEHSKIIVAHLGAGGSLTAVKDGKSINTSMGFTPLAGIMMGTRSGDIDPSIIPYVMEQEGKNASEVIDDLNKRSGLFGMSEYSSDMRDILEKCDQQDEKAIVARDKYVRRVVDYIAQYYVLLGGADVIVFTAGVGENSIPVRRQICEELACLGVKIDLDKNNVRGEVVKISTDDSSIDVYVIPTDEELMIARDTLHLINR